MYILYRVYNYYYCNTDIGIIPTHHYPWAHGTNTVNIVL